MRPLCALVLAMLAGGVGGCNSEGPIRSLSWFKAPPSFRGPVGPDVVQIDVAVLERPVGDRYLNDDLWALADEQIVPLEHKDVLAENGLRIAQLGGLIPPEFLALITSERSNPDPRRHQVRAGQPVTIPIGPVREQSTMRFSTVRRQDAQRVLKNAQFEIIATPSLGDDNKVRLTFTPQIRLGEAKLVIKPAEDGSGWTCQEQPVSDKYRELSWETTLVSGTYLLVGCWFGRSQTFGSECFIRADEARPVQRMLVLRAFRQQRESVGDSATETNAEDASSCALPIALQASGMATHR
jgi:hypothetical protein